MMNTDDSSTSGYLTDEYEGLSTSFADVEQLPSTSYCDLYRAKRFGRWYLLKCLRPEHQGDEAYRQMLRKELEILMRLQHPGVMQAVGMETVVLPVRGAAVCMVAEWIDGMTLADYLQTELSVHQLRRVAIELTEAVAYVHQQQVVHRDLKPRNVMVTSNGGYVKLIDFGLADTDSHAILKQPAGTLRYIAPEQARLAQADVRNDIYSLGVMMQEMNDRLPTANPLRRVVPQHIVDRCLAPIDHRWQDMDALLEALRRSIQLPPTIRRLRVRAFSGCWSLKTIDLPEDLERIDNDAILRCGIDSIYIPAATTSIATTGVSACEHLTRVVVSPQNPVYDSRDNCNAIIESRTNMMVSGSAVARIPRSVTSLSDEAFNFFDPVELTIPAQITRIGPWTFATRIGRVYLESSIPPAFDSQGGRILLIPPAYDDYPGPEIYVPIGSLPAYEQADGWRQLSDYIREYPAKPVEEPLRLFAFTVHEQVFEVRLSGKTARTEASLRARYIGKE